MRSEGEQMNFDFKGDPSVEPGEERRAGEVVAEAQGRFPSMESNDECQYCGNAYENMQGCQYCMSNPVKREYREHMKGQIKKQPRKMKKK
jgi:hypothetical protein